MRKSGIDIIGDVPWGTHICHFYQSQEDLIDILAPYFKAGLENYEFCVWVTSPPLDVKEAMAALKKEVKNLEDYIKKGQIEIIDGNQWYVKTGKFEADKVLDGWLRKEKKAKKRGFDGLRLAGNTSWLEDSDWKNFIDYDGKVQNDIGKKRMIAICSYSLDKCGTAEAIDVTSHHQLALIKKEGRWMLIENSEHRKKEEALQQSIRLRDKILEFSPEVIGIVDAKGNILDVNKRLDDWVGYKPEEVLGKNFLELPFLLDESKAIAKEKLFQSLLGKDVGPYELDFITKRGEKRVGRILVSPIRDKNGELIEELVMASDITESKQAKEALEESEKKYRTLAENAMDGIYIITPEGFEYVNPGFEKILGYKAKEVCSKEFNFFNLIHPEDRKLIARREEARKKGKKLPSIYSFRVLTKDGKLKHVEVDTVRLPGKKVKILGILRDMTERKKAEEALRESEELFRSIVENSHAGILIVNDSYRLVYVNDELCRMLGYSQKEIIGQDFRRFVDEESRRFVADRYVRRQRGEKVPSRYEFNLVRKNGEKRRAEIISTVIKDSAGKTQSVAQILDITERQRAEEALRESEEKYSNLFLYSNDAIFIHDLDGNIIDANQKVLDLFGYTKSEILSLKIPQLHPSEELEASSAAFEKISKEGFVKFEIRFEKKSGELFPAEVSSSLFRIGGEKVIQGIVRDITERRRAEERLRVEKARLDSLFESAQEGIVMADKEGRVMSVNNEFIRLFGYMPEEVKGRNVDELVVSKEELNKGMSITRKVARGKNFAFEAMRQHKDGTLIDVSVLASPIMTNGEVVAIYGIYRDITERKRAEEALGISEEKYRNLVELSPDAILFLDMKGVVTSCNTFMTKATGYSKEEIIGKHLTELELLPAEDIPKYMKIINSAARGKVAKPFEVSWHHKDGTFYLAEVRIGFIKEKERNVGVQVVARDITERKRAEEKIKSSLKEKEVMLREIHHRVKNNMQIISSLLRLQSRQIKNKKILDSFDVSQNRIRSMALIHESLYKSNDLARINFSDYINRLTIHLFSIYRTGMNSIELRIEVGDVFLDINRAIPCGLIINELVSNSLKHAFPDGRRGEIAVKMDKNKRGKYLLLVKDTGIGFPVGVDFHQTETLGMQLVTDLVRQLDGNIKLKRDGGTEFRIVF